MFDLKKIWQHKRQIAEGAFNSVFIRESIEQVAVWRQEICQSNKCMHYDPQGTSPKAVVKNKPACGICGCNIHFLTRSMSSRCSLHEINQPPLWDAELTHEEENNLHRDDQVHTS